MGEEPTRAWVVFRVTNERGFPVQLGGAGIGLKSAAQLERSSRGVAPTATANRFRSLRKPWCITYIIFRSTGPPGAAAWPGNLSWSGCVVVVLMPVLLR